MQEIKQPLSLRGVEKPAYNQFLTSAELDKIFNESE